MSFIVDILMWTVYLLSLYIGIFWLINLFENRHEFKKRGGRKIVLKSFPFVSVIIPAYNEEKGIEATIDSAAALDYPADRFEIIVVNDGSTDKTREISEAAIGKHKGYNIQLINQENLGKACALNNALKIAKGEFFACLDADSFVEAETLKKMLKVYEKNDIKLTIVTPVMHVASPHSMIQWLQKIEYTVSMFVARIMSKLDTIYVAPGPFSLYRTKTIRKLGGFDANNLTEDQEIGYRVQKHHFKIKQCSNSVVYTIAPKSLLSLYYQRRRWMRGSISNLVKYKSIMFNKKYGDFGMFQMPLNMMTYFFSLSAITLFIYLVIRPIVLKVKNLFLIRFDFWPYLKDLFKYDFNLINYDLGRIFVFLVILVSTIMLLYFAYKQSHVGLTRAKKLYLVPYLFVYYVLLSSFAVKIMFDIITRRKSPKW